MYSSESSRVYYHCSVLSLFCIVIALNVHETSEEKSDGSKGSSYYELRQVFDNFPKYHMKILL
jgi:hypothetical protein